MIENAIKKLSSAIDLTGSPLGGAKMRVAPPPKPVEEEVVVEEEPAPAPAAVDMS